MNNLTEKNLTDLLPDEEVALNDDQESSKDLIESDVNSGLDLGILAMYGNFNNFQHQSAPINYDLNDYRVLIPDEI
jgi:hypothetical protein